MHPLLLVMGGAIPSLNGTWSDISVTFPTTEANNEDRQVTLGGGAPSATVKNSWNNGGTLEYRKDAGAWTTYTQGGSGFSVNTGQTVAWRFTPGGNFSVGDAAVTIGGVLVDTFTMQASGFP